MGRPTELQRGVVFTYSVDIIPTLQCCQCQMRWQTGEMQKHHESLLPLESLSSAPLMRCSHCDLLVVAPAFSQRPHWGVLLIFLRLTMLPTAAQTRKFLCFQSQLLEQTRSTLYFTRGHRRIFEKKKKNSAHRPIWRVGQWHPLVEENVWGTVRGHPATYLPHLYNYLSGPRAQGKCLSAHLPSRLLSHYAGVKRGLPHQTTDRGVWSQSEQRLLHCPSQLPM